MDKDEDLERAESQAKSQLEGIREMLAALNVDYDKLGELRGLRKSMQEAVQEACEACDDAEVDEAAGLRDGEPYDRNAVDEACEALEEAEEDLFQFGRDHGEELAELEADAGDCESREDAEQRIQEGPLSVEVRSCWHTPGDNDLGPCEFRILLCTGGPAVQIRGELGTYNEPERAWLEYQDWFTPWIEYFEPGNMDTLVEYASQFYFGE